MIDLLVVDDHDAVRAGVAELFARVEGFTVTGTAADGVQAVAAVRRLCPAIALMDVSMPVMDGIAATEAALTVYPQLRVVMLSASVTATAVLRACAAGALGYQLKSTHPDELIAAVRAVAAGGHGWCSQALELLNYPRSARSRSQSGCGPQ